MCDKFINPFNSTQFTLDWIGLKWMAFDYGRRTNIEHENCVSASFDVGPSWPNMNKFSIFRMHCDSYPNWEHRKRDEIYAPQHGHNAVSFCVFSALIFRLLLVFRFHALNSFVLKQTAKINYARPTNGRKSLFYFLSFVRVIYATENCFQFPFREQSTPNTMCTTLRVNIVTTDAELKCSHQQYFNFGLDEEKKERRETDKKLNIFHGKVQMKMNDFLFFFLFCLAKLLFESSDFWCLNNFFFRRPFRRYPKPGTKNPVATLKVADLADPKNFRIRDIKPPALLINEYFFFQFSALATDFANRFSRFLAMF